MPQTRIFQTLLTLSVALLLSMIVACSDDKSSGSAEPATGLVQVEPPPSSVAEAPAPTVTAPLVTEPQPAPIAPPPQNESAAVVNATQYTITGVVTQWKPAVLFVEPGARVVFKQMTGHDTEAIAGMIPKGAVAWKSTMGEEGFSIELTVPGAYIYKCNPHWSSGMVAAIVVGVPTNLAEIDTHPDNKGMIGRAIRLMKQAQVKASGQTPN